MVSPEILLLIFLELSLHDLMIVSRVSTLWNRIANHPCLWKYLFHKEFSGTGFQTRYPWKVKFRIAMNWKLGNFKHSNIHVQSSSICLGEKLLLPLNQLQDAPSHVSALVDHSLTVIKEYTIFKPWENARVALIKRNAKFLFIGYDNGYFGLWKDLKLVAFKIKQSPVIDAEVCKDVLATCNSDMHISLYLLDGTKLFEIQSSIVGKVKMSLDFVGQYRLTLLTASGNMHAGYSPNVQEFIFSCSKIFKSTSITIHDKNVTFSPISCMIYKSPWLVCCHLDNSVVFYKLQKRALRLVHRWYGTCPMVALDIQRSTLVACNMQGLFLWNMKGNINEPYLQLSDPGDYSPPKSVCLLDDQILIEKQAWVKCFKFT